MTLGFDGAGAPPVQRVKPPASSSNKMSRSKLVVVNVRSADLHFAHELSHSLVTEGITVEPPAVAPPQGMIVLEVLDEPVQELHELFHQSIILARAGDEALAIQAARAGAAALFNKPVSMSTLIVKVRLIVNQLLEIDSLRHQVEKLGAMLTEEQTVSLAVGMLAERFHLPPNEAYERLRRHARSTQAKLRSLGAEIVKNASTANELFRAALRAREAPATAAGPPLEASGP